MRRAFSPTITAWGKIPDGVKLTFILLLAALLRLFQLGYKPFWADEGIAWWMALGEVRQDAPIIYRYAFNWAIQLFGWHEWAGRLPSVLFGVGSIPVIYAIGKTIYNAKFGLWAAFLAAISAYLIPLSQEMRIYSLLGLELLLATWFFLRILKSVNGSIGWWISLFLIGVIGQYTHCFFILVLSYLGLALILKEGRRGIRFGVLYGVLLTVVLLLSLPEIQKSLTVAGVRQHVYATDLGHFKLNIYRVIKGYFGFLFGDYLTNLPGTTTSFFRAHPLHLTAGMGMVVVWLTLAFQSLRELFSVVLGSHFQTLSFRLLLGMVVAFTLLFCIVDISTSAHLVFAYVPFLFLVASAFRPAIRTLQKSILLAIIFLTVISLSAYYRSSTFPYERAEWRAAGRLLQHELKTDDAVLLLRSRNAYYTLRFYDSELVSDIRYYPRHDPGVQANPELVKWWQQSPVEQINDLFMDHRRVWVIESDHSWDPLREGTGRDYQAWDLGENLRIYRVER